MSSDRAVQAPIQTANRIIVALDASPHSAAALRAAAQLADVLDIELEGIFVEDINLVHLCAIPFGCEVGSLTAAIRRLDRGSLERQMRSLAHAIRQDMQRTLSPKVRWTFRVRRGAVAEELLAAAQDLSILTLGRSSNPRWRRLGSTAQTIVQRTTQPLLILDSYTHLTPPFAILYTGSPAANRALALAAQLAHSYGSVLHILIWPQSQAGPDEVEQLRKEIDLRLSQFPAKLEVVQKLIQYEYEILSIRYGGHDGTLLLPGEQARLLVQQSGPIILVP